MRLYTYTKSGEFEEIAECENPFRTDGSFKSFCRAIFKRAISNDYIVIFTLHNKRLIINDSLRIED